ncbi:MAG: hypothetical protein KBF13_07700 [Prevotella sp.]|nr:hypothetical protein [Prevotella sp.]
MDNNILNNLVLYKGKWFSDLVDTAKISVASQQNPYQVSQVLSYVFGTKDNGYSTSIDMLTGGLGNVMTIDQPSWEWQVMIDADRAVTIRDAKWNGSSITSTSTAGLGNTPILLWLEDNWFGPGAILEFDNKDFQVRVSGAPYQDGNMYVYTCFIADGNPASYVPAEYLEAGRQVSRLASAYEEYSEESDILNYNTHFKMRNYLTTVRLSYDITGSAFSTVMAVALKDPKSGKTSYLWSTFQEWKAMREWYKRCERFGVYAKSNVNKDGSCNLKGSNGRPVFIGAGLLEQIAPSNRRFYTKLTAELLEDFLSDLSYNILGTNERKFIALTGEMGMREFDRVLKEKVTQMNLMDTIFVTGSGDNLTFGGQFKTYKMTNGIELTLKYFPLYDDTTYNRMLHPVSLKPLESYRMTFIDLGRRDGEANLVKVVRKDREFVNWCVAGAVTPAGYGHSNSEVRSNAKDGYSVNFLGEMGWFVRDPRGCGELICDAEA